MIYSFDLSDYEAGKFTATRYSDRTAVSGDWVCRASSDAEAVAKAKRAAEQDWAAPDTRHHLDFAVDFVDAHSRRGGRRHGLTPTGPSRPITVRLGPGEFAALEAYCAQWQCTPSEAVRRLLTRRGPPRRR